MNSLLFYFFSVLSQETKATPDDTACYIIKYCFCLKFHFHVQHTFSNEISTFQTRVLGLKMMQN